MVPFWMPEEALVALGHIEYGTPFLKTGTDDARVLPILDRADAHVVPPCQRTLGDSCGVDADIGNRLSGLHAFAGFFQSSFHTLHYKSRLTELKRTAVSASGWRRPNGNKQQKFRANLYES